MTTTGINARPAAESAAALIDSHARRLCESAGLDWSRASGEERDAWAAEVHGALARLRYDDDAAAIVVGKALSPDLENADTVRTIDARGRASDDLAAIVRHLRLDAGTIAAIADAVRHCPHGIAEIGRALAYGGTVRDVVGPSGDQDATRHLEHARDHLAAALAYPDGVTDTGLLESGHAGARCALAIEVVRGGGR